MKQYYVYILKCADSHYYTGVTNDLDRRIWEHETGFNSTSYTYRRRPVELVFCLDYNDITLAIDFEKQVKGWNRKKKEAIINGDWERLRSLAACKNETSHMGFDSAQPDTQNDSAQPDNEPLSPERSRRVKSKKGIEL